MVCPVVGDHHPPDRFRTCNNLLFPLIVFGIQLIGLEAILRAKGTDYRLYEGYSYIGRDPAKNQVAIPDDHISSVPSARILYDTGSRKFFINECNGARNPVYLNGDLFDGRVELKPYDMIKMGNTRLLFVPLCTEKFAWEE